MTRFGRIKDWWRAFLAFLRRKPLEPAPSPVSEEEAENEEELVPGWPGPLVDEPPVVVRPSAPVRSKSRPTLKPKPKPPRYQIVWGKEPVAHLPWIDSATAACLVFQEDRRFDSPDVGHPSIEVVVVGRRWVETHRFRPGSDPIDGGNPAREAVRIDPAGSFDPSSWERPGSSEGGAGSARVIVAEPSVGSLPIPTDPKTLLLDSDQLYRSFDRVWDRRETIARSRTPVDYRLRFHRARWGTTVPHGEVIGPAVENLSRVYHLGGGRFDDFSLSFEVDRISSETTSVHRSRITGTRLVAQRDQTRTIQFDACPATGASRFLFRSEADPPSAGPRTSRVFWPIAGSSLGERPIPPSPDSPVAVSLCLAVAPATAALAWREVAPLIDRLRELGRFAGLQVVWGAPTNSRKTAWWSPRRFEAERDRFSIEVPGQDSPDGFLCRGLSGALGESLKLPGTVERDAPPPVGLVIVAPDYEAGSDPTFGSTAGRWAWFVRLRRSLGGPVALLAYELGGEDEMIEPSLGMALSHLVILGRQANGHRAPLARFPRRGLQDRDAVETEVQAILAVADRMGRLAGPLGAIEVEPTTPAVAPLWVMDREETPGTRPSRPPEVLQPGARS